MLQMLARALQEDSQFIQLTENGGVCAYRYTTSLDIFPYPPQYSYLSQSYCVWHGIFFGIAYNLLNSAVCQLLSPLTVSRRNFSRRSVIASSAGARFFFLENSLHIFATPSSTVTRRGKHSGVELAPTKPFRTVGTTGKQMTMLHQLFSHRDTPQGYKYVCICTMYRTCSMRSRSG